MLDSTLDLVKAALLKLVRDESFFRHDLSEDFVIGYKMGVADAAEAIGPILRSGRNAPPRPLS